MKKRLFILITFVICFFNIECVNAAAKTCVYDLALPGKTKYYLITSNDTEIIYFYSNDKEGDIKSSSWELVDSGAVPELKKIGVGKKFAIANNADKSFSDINGILDCPKRIYYDDTNSRYVIAKSGGLTKSHGDLLSNGDYNDFFTNLNGGSSGDSEITGSDLATSDFGKGKTCGSLKNDLETKWFANPNGRDSCLYAGVGSYDINNDGKSDSVCYAVQLLNNGSAINGYSNYTLWSTVYKITYDVKTACPDELYLKITEQQIEDKIPSGITVFDSSSSNKEYDIKLAKIKDASAEDESERTFTSCELISDDVVKVLNDYMNVLRVLIPIILFVLGTVDFAKATFASKDDDMKKAQQAFFKRIIICVIIFFIPTFVNLVIKLFNIIWGANIEGCGLF